MFTPNTRNPASGRALWSVREVDPLQHNRPESLRRETVQTGADGGHRIDFNFQPIPLTYVTKQRNLLILPKTAVTAHYPGYHYRMGWDPHAEEPAQEFFTEYLVAENIESLG